LKWVPKVPKVDVHPLNGKWRVEAIAAIAAGVAGCAYRFLAHTSFNNDQFVHLARAQAWLAGDWPIRDYEEPGAILTVGFSAAAQALFGQTLLPELLLSVAALGIGAGVTCWLVIRLTGSRALGILAAVLQIAIAPRLYAYPKILLYPVGLVLLHRYIVSPTRARLAIAAAWVALSFLIRQDHGVYLGLATALTVVVVHWRNGATHVARQLGTLTALCFVLVLPFLIYVQANIGLWRYLQLGVGTYQGEASRNRTLPTFTISGGPLFVRQPADAGDLPGIHIRWAPHIDDAARMAREREVPLLHPEHVENRTWRYRIEWDRSEALAPLFASADVEDVNGVDRRTLALDAPRPFRSRALDAIGLRGLRFGPAIVSLSRNAGPFLFYTAWLLPFAVFLLWLKDEDRDRALIVPIVCALALLCAAGFQRDEPAIRTPDVFGTFPILLACALAVLFSIPSGRARTLARAAGVVLAVLVCASVVSLGDTGQMLSRAGLFDGPGAMVTRAASIARSARDWPWPAQWPGDDEWKVARYVHDCTRSGDRLLVTWFAPEFYVFSRRPFAGRETVLMPVYRDPSTYERRVLETWHQQNVPIVLAEESTYPGFAAAYPALADYISTHYRQVATMASRGDMIRIYAERGRDFTHTDPELGWECLAGR
jgi:hypothetical protein